MAKPSTRVSAAIKLDTSAEILKLALKQLIDERNSLLEAMTPKERQELQACMHATRMARPKPE